MDIDTDVRIECTKSAKFFFLHHPELVAEITGTKMLSLDIKLAFSHNNVCLPVKKYKQQKSTHNLYC